MKQATLMLIALMAFTTFAQTSGYTYEAEQSYQRQKRGGIIMIIGGALAVGGGVAMAMGDADGAPVYGSILAVGGLSVNILGIVSLVRAKRYKADLEEYSEHPLSAGDSPEAPSLSGNE